MNTHKHLLREISKFASGLVVADFITGLWLQYSHLLPLHIVGVVFESTTVLTWMIVDIILFFILMHYAWHADVHTPSLKQKNLFIGIGVITGVIALIHLARIFFGVSLNIGGWEFPYWLSGIAVAVASYISYASFRFSSK